MYIVNIGELVESTKGRDIGQIYLVIGFTQTGDLILVNGDNKLFEKPKTKNRKHIKRLDYTVSHLQKKLNLKKCIYNAEVYSCIKKYKEN